MHAGDNYYSLKSIGVECKGFISKKELQTLYQFSKFTIIFSEYESSPHVFRESLLNGSIIISLRVGNIKFMNLEGLFNNKVDLIKFLKKNNSNNNYLKRLYYNQLVEFNKFVDEYSSNNGNI